MAAQEFERLLIGCHGDRIDHLIWDWAIANRRSLCTRHFSEEKIGDPLERLLPVDDWQASFFGCQICLVGDVQTDEQAARIRELGGEVWVNTAHPTIRVMPADRNLHGVIEDDVRLAVYKQLDRFPRIR